MIKWQGSGVVAVSKAAIDPLIVQVSKNVKQSACDSAYQADGSLFQ